MTDDKLTIGSLFSGIGGLELGLERTGYFETRWQCEINDYARKVLAKNWPGLPIYTDVKELYESEFPEPVDVLCGGFPCQPFSTAGKRRGEQDERFLWPEFVRIVRQVRPRWVVAENVPGLLTIDSGRVFSRILRDLAECGYYVEWDTISAASVGALHPRNRIFIVGRNVHADGAPGQYSVGQVPTRIANTGGNCQAAVLAESDGHEPGAYPGTVRRSPEEDGRDAEGNVSGGCRQVLAYARRPGLQAERAELPAAGTAGEGSQCPDVEDPEQLGRQAGAVEPGIVRRFPEERYAPDRSYNPGGEEVPDAHGHRLEEHEGTWFGQSDAEWDDLGGRIFGRSPEPRTDWAIEPDVGRVANGIPARVDRLRCLGNAVVPQCARYIGERIIEYERGSYRQWGA